MNSNRNNQDDIYKSTHINYKDIDTNIYTLKINSKSRNLIVEPNPFNFELIFNENPDKLNKKAIIGNRFDHIKKIQIAQILIPRFIPRSYMGEPFNGITPIYNSSDTITLSYYPGININNNVISVTDISGNLSKIEVLELVDLNNKKIYLLSIQYNNHYYLSKYINIKADLYSYLNINDHIYPIIDINGTLIQLGNTTNYPLPLHTNNRLIIGDYYKNVTYVDNIGTKIGYTFNNNNKGSILIYGSNILNYQYVFSNQYLEYQLINETTKNSERYLFLINNISSEQIDLLLPKSVENTKIIINGIWTDELPSNYNYIDEIIYNNDPNITIRLSQFNFGIRDLLDDKIFYLNMHPYTPNKLVATESTINNTFGVFFPSTQSKDYLYLRGDAFESYNITNLQNTNNKIKFSLLDSNYEQVGTIYNKFFNLYQPSNSVSINSYLPNAPDVTIIMKIEQIERKNTNQSIV